MTPCAASRTQTCARTFNKDFTVGSSGVSLRVFHRRTRWCKPSQQHAHTRKPSARPSRDRAAGVSTALHCTHTRAHILHTHAHPFAEQDSSRSLVAARGASAIPSFWPASACSPGPSTLRRNCRSMPAQVQVGPVSGSCCCQALVARHQRKAQPQESASRCACRRTDAGKTLTRASAAQERMENSENSGKTRKGHCKSKSRS